jgi:hypothetical protein
MGRRLNFTFGAVSLSDPFSGARITVQILLQLKRELRDHCQRTKTARRKNEPLVICRNYLVEKIILV